MRRGSRRPKKSATADPARAETGASDSELPSGRRGAAGAGAGAEEGAVYGAAGRRDGAEVVLEGRLADPDRDAVQGADRTGDGTPGALHVAVAQPLQLRVNRVLVLAQRQVQRLDLADRLAGLPQTRIAWYETPCISQMSTSR